MVKKYISVDINDERMSKIAEILANKTAKKILNLLAEKELSESDIANELGIAINTVEYNLKKLMEAGLVEKATNYFWSTRGKRIVLYRASNKKIIISPKTKFGGLLASVIGGGFILGGLKIFVNYLGNQTFSGIGFENRMLEQVSDKAITSAPELGRGVSSIVDFNNVGDLLYSVPKINIFQDIWIWIFIGFILGAVWSFFYRKMKGGINN
jgi:DNA-binding transcriptional ArsR family regulator